MAYPVYRVDQVRSLDEQTIAAGTSASSLMTEAGRAAYQCLRRYWPKVTAVCVLCGPGNNGGDGYVLARLAAEGGLSCTVVVLAPQKATEGAAVDARKAALTAGVVEQALPEGLDSQADTEQTVFVDAMFGAGFRGQLHEQFAIAADWLSKRRSRVLALDIPSGLNADTGVASSNTVQAAVTITFIGYKLGLLTGAGPEYCGQLEYAALTVPDAIRGAVQAPVQSLGFPDVMQLRPRRTPSFHKGRAGKVLIIGGAPGMRGATIMAAEAASRVGAGTVNLFTSPEHVTSALVRCPTVMVSGVEHPVLSEQFADSEGAALLESMHKASGALVLGPGLGQGAWGQSWVYWLKAASTRPLVLDADALNIIASLPNPEQYFHSVNAAGLVITPHPGEAARLLHVSVAEIQNDRYEAVKQLVKLSGALVILKGAGTLVGWLDAGGRLRLEVCLAGNPGMASGGMGDVLSGVLGGLLAQGLSYVDAGRLGCCLHSEAADRLTQTEGQVGLLATDLPPMIRYLLHVKES
ncbi:MAG: NAD(P)H-hydrate dehydratase [Pseudohongiella nitratireducens]|nr:NAD(P)H-hydrate dehydratase [Pseudohongiella nitratireducens]MDF1624119.1 NAD(P)H-hydrate dehydratase [Pseudohongiella nitratireducens]